MVALELDAVVVGDAAEGWPPAASVASAAAAAAAAEASAASAAASSAAIAFIAMQARLQNKCMKQLNGRIQELRRAMWRSLFYSSTQHMKEHGASIKRCKQNALRRYIC
jgi:hypothetical protein